MASVLQEAADFAPTGKCSTSLHLLLDGSSSVSLENWHKQVEATAKALENPEVIQLLVGNNGSAVTVGVFHAFYKNMVAWKEIDTERDAKQLAMQVRLMKDAYPQGPDTQVGYALEESSKQFTSSPCGITARKIIDISTDGLDTYLLNIHAARDKAIKLGITINGIGIHDGVPPNSFPITGYSALTDQEKRVWLKENVVTPDGFAMVTDFVNYPEVLTQKIIKELNVAERDVRAGHGR